MDQRNPLPGRITHRLNLDSQEEQKRQQQQRLEREQYQRQKQEKRKKKEQKRKAKQQQQRAAKQEAQKKVQQRKKQLEIYNDPAKLFQPDSDSGVSFGRLKRKINVMYPKYAKKKNESQSQSESDEEEQQQQQQSQQQSQEDSSSSSQSDDSSKKKRNKKNKKSEKRKIHQSDSEQRHQRKKMKSGVKVQPQMSAKDKLVQQVAVRWNYALPEWPPIDYNYQQQLNRRGFRAVQFSKFKFVDQCVDGLIKVYELDGFKGVYRGKNILVDVRPKEECPSLNYFYSRSDEQLTKILKRALQKQLQLLQEIKFKQGAQQKLLQDLKRKIRQLQR